MQRSTPMNAVQFPHLVARKLSLLREPVLILRRLDRRVTLLLRDRHLATARGAYETLFLGRNNIRGRRFRARSGRRFCSVERFDRAIQFVALCDEEGDDVVSRH